MERRAWEQEKTYVGLWYMMVEAGRPGKGGDHVELVTRVGKKSIQISALQWTQESALGTSLVAQRLKRGVPLQGAQVQSLVGELRSHMPCGVAKNLKKKKKNNNPKTKYKNKTPKNKNQL